MHPRYGPRLLRRTTGIRWLMITVEPWAHAPATHDTKTLLQDARAGRYDAQIDEVCSDIATVQAPLFLRWGHEMETPTGRYPWAQHNSAGYIAAYRHFVERCRRQTTRPFYVWSPRGDDGLDRYFPGADVVDYVGLSVYSLPAWEWNHYGRRLTFAENFGEKYERVKKYDKPVMIAELGVQSGSPDKDRWIAEALAAVDAFPLLKTVVYFNATDSAGAWDDNYGVPDWHISPDHFTRRRD